MSPHSHCRSNSPQEDDDRTITRALAALQSRLQTRSVLAGPEATKTFLRLQSEGLDHEVFAVMYLDARHQLIAYERLFRGTLTYTPVFPREVAKQALKMNAACVVLHHNHPSGACDPSADDRELTQRLVAALELVDVRVLDHVITSDAAAFSMAENGLLF